MNTDVYLPEWHVDGVLRLFDGFGVPTNAHELRGTGCLVLGNRADPVRVLSHLAKKLAPIGDAKRNRRFVAIRNSYLKQTRGK
jgi:hypothetical protein